MLVRLTLFLSAFAFINSNPLLAQGYFQKVYSFQYIENFIADMEILPDGRVVIAGSTHFENDLNRRTFLMLLNANGDIVWSKRFVYEKSNQGADVALAHDGNLILGLNATDASEQSRIGILKTNLATGEILWETYFSVPKRAGIASIKSLANGGYIVVVGRQYAPSTGEDGLSIIFKIDEVGNILWEKDIVDFRRIVCRGAAENSAGDIYVTGFAYLQLPSLWASNILIKFSSNGDVLWSQTYKNMYSSELCLDAEDNIWLTGNGLKPDTTWVLWAQKLDASGNSIWAKYYDLDLPHLVELSSIHPSPEGGAVITAHDPIVGKSNTLIARIESAGSVLWVKKYAASMVNDYLQEVATTAQGDIVAAGVTGASFDDLDFWLVKADGAGDIPDCCQTDIAFNSSDFSPEIDTVNFLTSNILQTIPGAAFPETAIPNVTVVCPMPTEKEILTSPNAFTPNDDGVNDFFRPRFECPPLTLLFVVYNRWGKKVFETTDIESPGWDGKSSGVEAPSDVYVWRVEYEVIQNGKRGKLTDEGDVTLLR